MILQKGLVYTPEFTFRQKNIRISQDIIEAVSEKPLEPDRGEEVMDLTGAYLIPGLTDIHFHGCMGYDTNDATDEALSAMAKYALREGIGAICPTTMTLPQSRIREICRAVSQHIPQGEEAELAGIHLEGPFIAGEKAGAQNPAFVQLPDTRFLEELLENSRGLLKWVTIAPEVEGAIDCIRNLHGKIGFSVGHTMASYEEAKVAFQAGATHLTHLFNAMPGIHHRSPGPIGAAVEQGNVMAEIICDGIHVHPAAVRLAFRLFGPENMLIVSDSIRACGMPDGAYELGEQMVMKERGAAWLNEYTLAGSTTNAYTGMVNTVRFGIPREEAVRAATYNPAREAGILHTHGTIEPGKKACLVVTNERLEKQGVIVGEKRF